MSTPSDVVHLALEQSLAVIALTDQHELGKVPVAEQATAWFAAELKGQPGRRSLSSTLCVPVRRPTRNRDGYQACEMPR